MMRFQSAFRLIAPAVIILAFPSLHAQDRAAQGPDPASHAPPAMSDASTAAAVEDEFRFDPMLSVESPKVQARDGTITLTGSTRTLLAKERSERIAETVQGVRSVENRIAVHPGVRYGAVEMRRLVALNLQQDPVVEALDIDILTNDAGDVTLRGTVDSWTERLFAANAAKRVVGVRSVYNEIQIVPKTGRFDSDVLADVRGKLRWDAYIDPSDLDVTVNEGAVRLSGTVRSAAEKRRAASIAWGPGVKSVSAQDVEVAAGRGDAARRRLASIQVRSGEEIAEAIAARFALSPRLSNAEVHVNCHDGVVTLRGSVRDLRARRAASTLARATAGVRDVRNTLAIRPTGPTLADYQIRSAIEQALRRDAITATADIHVKVVAGKAELHGQVDSTLAGLSAEEIASDVAGVTAVENDLTTDSALRPYVVDPYVDDEFDPGRGPYLPPRNR